MTIDVVATDLDAVLDWRERYRQEMNCQIVHDSWHARGFTDQYSLGLDGVMVGYGAVAGDPGEPKDTVKEFYLEPPHRGAGPELLRALIAASGAQWIEAQTNDFLLSVLLFDCAVEISSRTVLFADGFATQLEVPGAEVRRLSAAERAAVFRHTTEPVGDWGVVVGGQVVATGGYFLHYNPPFADLYMEVAPDARRQGYGSLLVQEVKRECTAARRVPAARCHSENEASRRTLQRAGLVPCGRIVRGRVAAESVNRASHSASA